MVAKNGVTSFHRPLNRFSGGVPWRTNSILLCIHVYNPQFYFDLVLFLDYYHVYFSYLVSHLLNLFVPPENTPRKTSEIG